MGDSMTNAGQVGIFLELRKRLQSGLLVLGSEVAGSPAEARVTAGESCLLIHTARGLLSLKLPPGISVTQDSFVQTSGQPGEELHFRMRITIDQNIDEKPCWDVMERLRVQETYSFTCQACGTRLLQDRVFRRVLPLPNGNWNALVDDWCCHPDPFANLKLLPRPEDCLLGDSYFLLPSDSGCRDTLTQEVQELTDTVDGDIHETKKPCRRRTVISCQSCSSGLGEAVTPDTLKLYVTEVEVSQEDGDSIGGACRTSEGEGQETDRCASRCAFLERTLAARLLELSSSQSIFRFSIQTADQRAHILLWLLNSDSLVLWAPEEAVTADVPDSPSLRPPSPSQSDAAAGALKLLYVDCSASEDDRSQKELITDWERTVSVHPLELPQTTCLELLRLLTTSTSCLPPSLRRCDAYQVAYLRM
ncbi:E3 ubiquitin-protein ligase E3D [Osmerus mordax]|uniref:E3 ubiquitin-protein ligase E3D n=1 Tax=Osmerus mordax TaxID=8014 RepID=UPI00350EA941